MKLAIYGTGGSGKEIYDMIISDDSLRYRLNDLIFINDYGVKEFKGCKVFSFNEFCENFAIFEAEVVIAVGEPSDRKKIYERVKGQGYKLATLISSHVYFGTGISLGEGVILKNNTQISSDAIIGDNVFMEGECIIGHDVVIGSHSQISSYSIVCGQTHVGEETFIGVSASVRDDIKIGRNSIIAMGAVVMKDVPDYCTVMGNPARVIAKGTDNKVFS